MRVRKSLGVACAAVAVAAWGCAQRPTKEPGPPALKQLGLGAPAQGSGPPKKQEQLQLPPADGATRLVQEFLKPSEQSLDEASARERGKRELSAAAFLERPALTLPAFTGDVARLPLRTGEKAVRPLPLVEQAHQLGEGAGPQPPQQKMKTLGPVRWPSPDVSEPPPLPVLAKPSADRVPVSDPAPETSVAAALAGRPPLRTTPAPFVRVNLPDPFEHSLTGRLLSPPAELPGPPVAPPRTPSP